MSESEQHKSKPWCQLDANGRFHWNIPSARRLAGFTCDGPGCLNHDSKEKPAFKRCAKCKSKIYCSKECQKKAWPSHKLACGFEPDDGAFLKILQKFVTNPFLYTIFRMLTIYKHGLHLIKEDALDAFRSKPFGLQLFLQYEPADAKVLLQHFSTLALEERSQVAGPDKTKEAVVAIPQIVAISIIPEQEITQMELARWKAALQLEGTKSSPDGKLPLLAVLRVSQWFGCQKAPTLFSQAVVTSLLIPDDSLRFARRQGPPPLSPDLPYPVGDCGKDIASTVDYANVVLRGDDDNGWRLRAKLPKLDKQLMAFASVPSSPALRKAVYKRLLALPSTQGGLAPPPFSNEVPSGEDSDFLILAWIDYLRKKLVRESIYRETAQRHGYDFEGLLKDIEHGCEEVPEVAIDISKIGTLY